MQAWRKQLIETFIEELSAALVFTHTMDMQPAQAFKLLAMAAIAGVPQVYHSSFSISLLGMITVTSRIETGNQTTGTLVIDEKHSFLHTGVKVYIIRKGFQFDKPLSLQEVRLNDSETYDCAIFVHLGGGVYEVTKEGNITCSKNTNYYDKGNIFSKQDNEQCNSSCATTGINLAERIQIMLDPLPARHPTLVRPREMNLDVPLGLTKSGADVRRVQALLDKTMADSRDILDSFKQEDYEIPMDGYFGMIASGLLVLGMFGCCAYLFYRHIKKKIYRRVINNASCDTGPDSILMDTHI